MHAFEDVDVLELSQYVAGPNCGQWLATLGANVVKLEPPDGESARRDVFDQFATFNLGGKRSLGLDLGTDEGAEIARDLAAEADVIVENYAPGALARFGLDHDAVVEENEDVVYCSISAFGEGGPYSEYPGIDHLMQPMSGLMAQLGHPDCPNLFEGGEYLFGTNLIVDFCTGVQGALLVAAALRRRDRTGEGAFLDMALFDTALAFVGTWIADYTAGEPVPRRGGDPGPFERSTVPMDVFEAGGEPLFVAAVNDAMFERLCAVIDRPDLLADERFGTRDSRRDHGDALREALSATIGSWDRDELFRELAEAGVVAGPFRDVPEVVDEDPHVEAREMLARTTDPRTGEDIRTAMIPFRTDAGRPAYDPPPDLGEGAREVLAGLGLDGERIDELAEAGVVTTDD